MTFGDWVDETKERYRTYNPWTATKWSASEFAIGAARQLGQRWNYGRNVWNHEWDLLIILDACRYDLLCEVVDEYEFLESPRPVYSAASMSEEWLERHTLREYRREMSQTGLISGNAFPYLSDTVREDEWAHVDTLVTHQWNDDHGTVMARSVTDATIDFCRHHAQGERAIAWYIQPHAPFIDAEWSDGFDFDSLGNPDEGGPSVWYRLRNGELDREELWSAYRDNLRYVLDDVEILLENVDADKVVITSDHANCLGECGIYGHPKYVPLPTLKRVPWVETTATDCGTYRPTYSREDPEEDIDMTERLSALGYV